MTRIIEVNSGTMPLAIFVNKIITVEFYRFGGEATNCVIDTGEIHYVTETYQEVMQKIRES